MSSNETIEIDSTKSNLHVVSNCRSVSDVSSTATYDTAVELAESNAEADDEQDKCDLSPQEDKIESVQAEGDTGFKNEILLTTGEKKTDQTNEVEIQPIEVATVAKNDEETLLDDSLHVCSTSDKTVELNPVSRRPFVPLTSKSWRVRAMESNSQLTRLMKAALLQTLLHAIRTGSVEGVKVAIERGVQVHYLDNRQRNLVMLASKCDTDARLHIVIILLDAGCDMNHKDQLGWNCLHYACASGANDVAAELVRRGARVEFNPYGYGPEDFNIPKVARAKSLLQHTEQLQHEQNVCAAWTYFRRQAEKAHYRIKCKSNCDLGKPLKITFQAPVGHSLLDRIRVVDMNSDVALWLQVSKTFSIPPGEMGTITLDVETLDHPSLYRIVYEKYEPTPAQPAAAKNPLCVKNLDTGKILSASSVNKLVLRQLKSSRSSTKSKKLSSSASRASEITERVDEATVEEDEEGEEETEFSTDETFTAQDVAEHPAVTSITGVYKIVAMGVVSVSTMRTAKANEYEITIRRKGHLGLQLVPKIESSRRSPRLIVRRSQGQTAAVNPGDCLVGINNSNIEHAGLKHTLWALNDAKRPLVLRFRRGNVNEKKSLFKTGLSKLTGPRRQPVIAV
ncbi:hypothetical protein PsorP6_004149 [Peronosclerospora sorghi]|uniref:Uncharacterized protein n=1 Tax=Peronosclerospora sorghi TaxID=230839 RepID=A0ACC0VNH0_9STRA|nr:hypothetical protein PsorP6_004149 [Peronosclerospora sorghi]